ncbi:sensor histidine kinase [Brevibacterium yomogidense]|uniref:sensor histidine kinase n=1 Tax=Brevibacterium yomogidense TaxID=946573 RepID=UPI0018E01686|nr:histidine kinase [Brevibacterium yomogidense]
MRRLLAWLWLIPVPLAFGLDVLISTGWLSIAGIVLAAAVSLPVLIRVQRGHTQPRSLRWAALGLLLALVPVIAADTMSLTALWLSLVTLAMLSRLASGPATTALLVVLAVANVLVPALLPDGLLFGLAYTTLIIAAVSIGLMLRFTDRSLAERKATAAEAERRRIATELHDVIAHEVTGIVVLAQAASRSDNAQLTSTALQKIEESGARALDEIRRLVSDPLREAASRTPIATSPQALRDRVEAYGGQATLSFDTGDVDDEAVWPALDRVLVESLTNVRRHAGPDAPVTVSIVTRDDSPGTLTMTVTNERGSGGIGAGSGTGLSSLRTRVGHLGGTIEAGPADGGWVVRTALPLTTRTRGDEQ